MTSQQNVVSLPVTEATRQIELAKLRKALEKNAQLMQKTKR